MSSLTSKGQHRRQFCTGSIIKPPLLTILLSVPGRGSASSIGVSPRLSQLGWLFATIGNKDTGTLLSYLIALRCSLTSLTFNHSLITRTLDPGLVRKPLGPNR
jgi:hypothetical protein